MTRVAPTFHHYLDKAMQAPSSSLQMEALKECVEALLQSISGPARDGALKALHSELHASRTDTRRLRTLQFCATVVYDKLPLPYEPGELPEFLWLFAVPFTVTFSAKQHASAAPVANMLVDAPAILDELESAGYFNDQGVLRASSRLFRREDLHKFGPRSLGELFLHAELKGEDLLEPAPLEMDPQLDAYRSATLFLLAASRLPVGQSKLMNRQGPWPGAMLERVVHACLQGQGLDVECVRSSPAHSLPEMLCRCAGPSALELQANLANAKTAYGELSVGVRLFGRSGYAEVFGRLPDGSACLLIPAFSYFETGKELCRCVAGACETAGLKFAGAVNLKSAQAAALQ